MANKIDTSFSGIFLETKLKVLLDNVKANIEGSNISTKEEVIALFNKATKEYYKTLNKSLLTYKPVSSGNESDIIKLNNDNLTVYNDLRIIYSSIEKIRELIKDNFNSLSGMAMKIKSDIAEASSNIIDYKIQNTNQFSSTFSDSFFNLLKVEQDESKYVKDKAFVDTSNENVVLPLSKEAETGNVRKITIIENSIGTSGNNQEIGALARETLRFAVDGSSDTWFEFEQVGQTELAMPTVLNLKLEFDKELFFNLLDIHVAQMPNGSYPAISEIAGSQDGSVFFDITSLYLGSTEYDSLGNKVIPLGEKASNPNGNNILYFTPKKLKFLTIKLTEDSSYFIKTSAGIRYRRAIGVREIKPKSQKFKTSGQFITSNFTLNKEISKIALFTDEFFPNNFKTTFDYFISIDNGQTWEQISPSQRIKENIPEVLNYNIDYLTNSKKTEAPVLSVKLKCDFNIKEGDQSTSVMSDYKTKNQTEFRSIATGTKSISLEKVPFGSVYLYKTNYGSVGKETYYKIPNSNLKELEDRYLLQLPIDAYPGQSIQLEQEQFFIDNYSWSRVDSLSEPLEEINPFIYEFDYVNNIATFYKEVQTSSSPLETKRVGRKPIGDIFFKLKRENVSLKETDKYTVIETNFPHDAIKDNIEVYLVEEASSSSSYRLKNLSSVHRPGVNEIESITVDLDTNRILKEAKPFINGVIELSRAGDYSIDKKRGVIYTYSPLNSTEEVNITIFYKKKNPIIFEIVDGEIRTSQELKKENRSFTLNVEDPFTFTFDFGFKNIDKKSIIFLDALEQLKIEVPFDKIDFEFNEKGTSGKYAIDYKNGIIYFQEKVTSKLSGTLTNSNYFAEYNITYKIPESNYTLVTQERRIDFSDKFISDYYNTSSNDFVSSSLLKIEYIYTEEVKESIGELIPYTTPFIKEYRIITTPKESL